MIILRSKASLTTWAYSIRDLTTLSESEINAYAEFWLDKYKRCGITDDDLWAIYQENFSKFSKPLLESLRPMIKLQLRAHLRSGGIFVAVRYFKKTVGEVLYEVA